MSLAVSREWEIEKIKKAKKLEKFLLWLFEKKPWLFEPPEEKFKLEIRRAIIDYIYFQTNPPFLVNKPKKMFFMEHCSHRFRKGRNYWCSKKAKTVTLEECFSCLDFR